MLLWKLKRYFDRKRKGYAEWRNNRIGAKNYIGRPCILLASEYPGVPGYVVEVGLLGFRFRDFSGQEEYYRMWQSRRLTDSPEYWPEIVAYHMRNNVTGMPFSLWRFLHLALPAHGLEEVGRKFGHLGPPSGGAA